MNSIVVGISDCQVSSDPEGVLLTYALGSCIAIALHDPAVGLSGLLHYMLPESTLDRSKAAENPYMFADTGIQTLLHNICERGASRRRLTVRIVGGAQIVDGHQMFQIGRRNYLAARKLLWKAGLLVAAEAVGGEVSRTVRLEVKSGRAWVREGGVEKSLSERRASERGN